VEDLETAAVFFGERALGVWLEQGCGCCWGC
jgi:hypothetical protein